MDPKLMTLFRFRFAGAVIALAIFRGAPGLAAPDAGELRSRAGQYFDEAAGLCRADNSGLWKVPLCGPMLLVEPASRLVFANQPDQSGILKKDGEIFTGKLPLEINVANTAVEWSGLRWTMMMLPLPAEKDRRAALMAHEMWHRVQNEIGFGGTEVANAHLDTRDGRIWLQLEWRALARALGATKEESTAAIRDATIFRAMRRTLSEQAGAEERATEMNEGLAEYTGVKLGGGTDHKWYVVKNNLKEAPVKESFVRSFAYATGPAYGLLLDETGKPWRENLKTTDDLADLLMKISGTALPEDLPAAASERAKSYGGEGTRFDRNESGSAAPVTAHCAA